jgi:phosphoglycerate dehydrogenase-like enzyme
MTDISSAAPQRVLAIACSLQPDRVAYLRAHVAKPEVTEIADLDAPWKLPQGTEILVSEARGWPTAPRERPEGWPGTLKWVHFASTGIDGYPDWIFDVPHVTCGRGVNAAAISEYVLGAMLLHEKRFLETLTTSRAGWKQIRLGGLEGKVMGLIGLGSIGAAIASRAAAFGMSILAYRRSGAPHENPAIRIVDDAGAVFAGADHVAIAAPLTPLTRHLVSRDVLARAKPGLHLVNIARGAIIDDAALLEALDAGQLSAATLDVTEPEPPPEGHAFYTHPKIRLTPHVSWSAGRMTERLMEPLAANIDRYLAGAPLEERVDKAHGY